MKKETAVQEKERLAGCDLRPNLLDAMKNVAEVRDLLDTIHEDDCLGSYFDNEISTQLDQLTQISLTLGKIYGYTMADDTLEFRQI